MATCNECKKDIDMSFSCKFCGKEFCSEHGLPENHNCSGLKNVKSTSITYLPTASVGDFPKTFKIRKQFEAEELAKEKISEDYKNFRSYEKFESRKEGNKWIVEGTIQVQKFLWTKTIPFKITIDAVSGKVMN